MNDLSFKILEVVVSVATALISVYVIPLLREKLKSEKYNQIFEIVEVAVRAAEQTIKGSGMGAVKKDQVLEFVMKWALSHGILITEEQLDQLIECAVYNLKMEAK